MADSSNPATRGPPAGKAETRPQGNSTAQSSSTIVPAAQDVPAQKRKPRHRAGKKRRNRRQSFAAPTDENPSSVAPERPGSSHKLLDVPRASKSPFYKLGQSGSNLSNTSLESEALLDHRDHPPMKARRPSTMVQSSYLSRSSHFPRSESGAGLDNQTAYRQSHSNPFGEGADHFSMAESQLSHSRYARPHHSSGEDDSADEGKATDRTPLISSSHRDRPTIGRNVLGGFSGKSQRANSRASSVSTSSSRRRRHKPSRETSYGPPTGDFDVNNPPSVPTSPKIGPEIGYGDVMVSGDFAPSKYPEVNRALGPTGRDSIIDIDHGLGGSSQAPRSSPPTPPNGLADHRRRTLTLPAEDDVCFPIEGMSEIAEEDMAQMGGNYARSSPRRRRCREWPDLSVLDDWSREEKEVRSEGIRRSKRSNEPVLVGGRLRPTKSGWHRAEEDAPYRFTYFNEEFPSTIHSQTISELPQIGQSFRDLFIPDPPVLSDDESEEEEPSSANGSFTDAHRSTLDNTDSRSRTRQSSTSAERQRTPDQFRSVSRSRTPQQAPEQQHRKSPDIDSTTKANTNKRHGARPTFWLDVLSPTDAEMRVISKAFGIHPLTAEDIMMQEAREKVELFRNYYFVNYRTFEQDMNSEDFLEPVDMYVVVFREGIISFHFSLIPHPANVRRRIRQLKDYLILSSDWISYAIIDDITDVFAPLIQSIEDEVDDIDDAILQLHSPSDSTATPSTHPKTPSTAEKKSEHGDTTSGESGGDMLRRVGDCRKKVMGLYRLLGNKADVIKGFAKRCNEQWEVAPRSEIGLYLGDIQDHIVTMTSNLSHYEKILSRSHSNYLAQINIRMNERQEQTADVLGRLTVLGTIVLPMNIITGLWGMNCLVPGQDVEGLGWFWAITAGLLCFGFLCYFIAKRVYKIV